jgi:hypothetical protein
VRGEFVGFATLDAEATAGESDEGEIAFGEEIAHNGRIIVEFLDAIGAKLNAVEAESGDVFDGFAVVTVPSDGGVAVPNVG